MNFSVLKQKLSATKVEIACARVHVHCSEEEAPLVSGTGQLIFENRDIIRCEVQVQIDAAQRRRLQAHRAGPKMFAGLSFTFEDYDGSVWAGTPRFVVVKRVHGENLLLSAYLQEVQVPLMGPDSPPGALVVFERPPVVPLAGWATTSITKWGVTEVVRAAESTYSFDADGYTFKVEWDAAVDELSIRASEAMTTAHPYLADLLVAPLKVLEGALYAPRYRVSYLGGGHAIAKVGVVPLIHYAYGRGAAYCFELENAADYWHYYATYFGHALRKLSVTGEHEEDALTPIHDEVTRASTSSSPVASRLALATSIESLCKTLPVWLSTPSTVTAEEAEVTNRLLDQVPNAVLQRQLRYTLKQSCETQQPAVSQVLYGLVSTGVIEAKHRKSWNDLRHHFAHGGRLNSKKIAKLNAARGWVESLLQVLTAHIIGYPIPPHHVDETAD